MPPRRSKGPSVEGIQDKVVEFITSFAKGEADDYLAVFKGALGPWLKLFALNAAPRIKGMMAQGYPCEASNERQGQRYPCDQVSAVQCAACGRKTCIHHSFVTWKGDAICWHCASHTVVQMSLKTPPGQPPGWQRPNVPPPGGHDVPPRGGRPPSDPNHRRMQEEVDRSLALLGLNRSASWDDVNKAFRSYVQRNHPDRVPEEQRAVAQEQFKQVNAAFNFLKEVGWGGQKAAS